MSELPVFKASAPAVRPLTVVTKEQLLSLRQRSTLLGALMLAHAWGVIAIAAAVAMIWPNPLTLLAAIMVIGSRQLGLLYIVHEGAHGTMAKTDKTNLVMSQWFAAYPMFAETLAYRNKHLHHHVTTLQPDDPDLHQTIDYPTTPRGFARDMLRDISGITAIKEKRAQFADAWGPKSLSLSQHLSRFSEKLGRPLLTNLVLLGLFTAAGNPLWYLVLWVLPMLTWQQAMRQVLALASHAVISDPNDPRKHARTTTAGPIARAFVFPYYSNYHLDHHIISYAPCYRMPRLHKLLKASSIGPEMEIEPNLLATLRKVCSKPEPVAA